MELLFPAIGGSPGDVGGSPGDVDLHAYYGAQWLEPGGVRVNFISSVDGAAAAAGLSRGLQSPGDNRIFGALRDLADVVVVGAATAEAERYHPMVASPERQQKRRSLGLSALPATAIISGSLQLDLGADLYRGASAESPTIVITGSDAPVNARNDVIDLAGSSAAVQLLEVPSAHGGVSFAAAMQRLRELGFSRILCEGGPRLFTAAVAENAVTELCLSVAPTLLGAAEPRIVSPTGWPAGRSAPLQLIGLLAEDSTLFCRYAVLPIS